MTKQTLNRANKLDSDIVDIENNIKKLQAYKGESYQITKYGEKISVPVSVSRKVVEVIELELNSIKAKLEEELEKL